MAYETLISQIVAKETAEQLTQLRLDLEAVKNTYIDVSKELAKGLKFKPETISGLTEKTNSYKSSIESLNKIQNEQLSIQKQMLAVIKGWKVAQSELLKISQEQEKSQQKNTEQVKKHTQAVFELTKEEKNQYVNIQENRKELEKLGKTVEELDNKFEKLTQNDVNQYLEKNSDGTLNYRNSIENLRDSIRELEILEHNYERALQDASISQQEYNNKISILGNTLDELRAKLDEVRSSKEENIESDNDLSQAFNQFNSSIQNQFKELTKLELEYDKIKEKLKELDQAYDQGKIKESQYVQQKAVITAALSNQNELIRKTKEILGVEIKEVNEAETSYKQLSATLKILETQYKSLSEQELQSEEGENLNDAILETKTRLEELNIESRKRSQEAKHEAKINKEAEGSYNQLSAQLYLLQARYKALSNAERQSGIGEKLKTEITDTKNQLKSLDYELGDYGRNVGNYQSHWSGLTQTMRDSNRVLGAMPGVTGQATQQVNRLRLAFNSLIKHPVAIIIAAIVLALKKMYDSFKESTYGADKLRTSFAYLEGVLAPINKLISQMTEAVVKFIEKAFKDPIQALKDFGNALLENVINRFKGLLGIMGSIGDILQDIFTGNFGDISKHLKEGLDSFLQFQTGVEGLTDKFIDLAKEMDKAGDEAADLKDKMIVLERQMMASERQLIGLKSEEEKYNNILKSGTLSVEDRQKAEDKLLEIKKQQAAINLSNAKKEFDLTMKQLDLDAKNAKKPDDIYKKRTEAMQKYQDKLSVYNSVIADIENKEAKRRQEELLKEIKLDADRFEALSSNNELLMSHEKSNTSERIRLFNEIKQKSGETFDSQIAKIEEYSQRKFMLDDLMQTKDEQGLINKIRDYKLEENIENKLIELIKNRQKQLIQLEETENDLEKERQQREIRRMEERFDYMALSESEQMSNELLELSRLYKKGLIQKEKYEKEKALISQKYAIQSLENTIKLLEQELEAVRGNCEEEERILKKLAESRNKLSITRNKNEQEANEQSSTMLQEWLQENEKSIKGVTDLINGASQLMSLSFSRQISSMQKELEDFNKRSEKQAEEIQNVYEASIRAIQRESIARVRQIEIAEEKGAISASEAEEQRREEKQKTLDAELEADGKRKASEKAIEIQREQIERRQQEIKIRQARWDKANAIVQATISTALAVIKAAPNPITMAFMAALGALQTIIIASQPIPQYSKGTKNHEGGFAVVGDGGQSEVILTNNKMYITPDKPTLVDMPKGTMVLPSVMDIIPQFKFLKDDFENMDDIFENLSKKSSKINSKLPELMNFEKRNLSMRDMDMAMRRKNSLEKTNPVIINNDYSSLEREIKKGNFILEKFMRTAKKQNNQITHAQWKNLRF